MRFRKKKNLISFVGETPLKLQKWLFFHVLLEKGGLKHTFFFFKNTDPERTKIFLGEKLMVSFIFCASDEA